MTINSQMERFQPRSSREYVVSFRRHCSQVHSETELMYLIYLDQIELFDHLKCVQTNNLRNIEFLEIELFDQLTVRK